MGWLPDGESGLDWASATLGAFIGIAGAFGLTSLALYPVMRRSFLLWNVGRTISFGVVAVAALSGEISVGIFHHLAPANLGDIGIALSAACAGPFLASYLESGHGLARMRKRLRWVAFVGLGACLASLCDPWMPALAVVHDLLLLVAIAAVLSGLVVAIRRGSRAARYQAIAWAPLMAIGSAELGYEIATGSDYWLWPLAVLFAVVVDFIVTTLGLIDGFMLIKRERDEAIADVREATRVSTLDPLTGIANRRGLSRHFADRSIGRPNGIAVIDCDHFKRVNDNFGHDVGDDVLVAVAESLQGENLYVGRLGGEEFVALAYSKDWRATLENARRRIEIGVRMRAPQLAFRVTASAGVAAVHDTDTLESAIKRADRALYAAKDAGRDRSLMLEDTDTAAARLAKAI